MIPLALSPHNPAKMSVPIFLTCPLSILESHNKVSLDSQSPPGWPTPTLSLSLQQRCPSPLIISPSEKKPSNFNTTSFRDRIFSLCCTATECLLKTLLYWDLLQIATFTWGNLLKKQLIAVWMATISSYGLGESPWTAVLPNSYIQLIYIPVYSFPLALPGLVIHTDACK